MHATDIVAYTYQAEILCPGCTLDALNVQQSLRDEQTTESLLDMLAVAMGLNRYDEREFDSGDFPKVVFASQLEPCGDCGYCQDGEAVAVGCADELCHGCGEPLI